MSLPTISHETHKIKVPVLERTFKFRPMTGYEEKQLLKAKESDERGDHVEAIRAVLESCSLEGEDMRRLPMFAVEYLFVRLRGLSISNVMRQTYRDSEDDKLYTVDINVEDVEVAESEEEPDNVIELPGDVTLELQWPTLELYADNDFYNVDEAEALTMALKRSTRSLHRGDESFDLANEPKEEVDKFVDSLPLSAIEKVRTFLASAPTLRYEVRYETKQGTERRVTLSTIDDFFTFA